VVANLPYYLQCEKQHGTGVADSVYIELRTHIDMSAADNATTEFGCGCYAEYLRLLRQRTARSPIELKPLVVASANPTRRRLRVPPIVWLALTLILVGALFFILISL
jgi:hypothetical protein